jgi:hypothetical protein
MGGDNVATKEEKISAMTNLLTHGILTADECACIVAMLDGRMVFRPARGKSRSAIAYENYMVSTVSTAFQNPLSVHFPPLEIHMVKQGTIRLDGKPVTCRYIETFVDAPNSRGVVFREPILLGVDNELQILWWAQRERPSTLSGKTGGWVRGLKPS